MISVTYKVRNRLLRKTRANISERITWGDMVAVDGIGSYIFINYSHHRRNTASAILRPNLFSRRLHND